MIIVFLGPPYAAKGTQAAILGEKLNLPVFSMGALIREAQEKGDKVLRNAYEKYSLKGLNLPTDIKFSLLRKKMNEAGENFILDNFPATEDDLKVFLDFLGEKKLSVDKVIYLSIEDEEMMRRLSHISRGRADDDPKIVETRRKIQDKDREPVLEYFKRQGVLVQINGEGNVEEINKKIEKAINDYYQEQRRN